MLSNLTGPGKLRGSLLGTGRHGVNKPGNSRKYVKVNSFSHDETYIYKLVYNYVLVVYLIQWPLQVESNTVPKLI